MQRLAYWLVPAIALCVAVFLVIFIIRINDAGPMPQPSQTSLKTEQPNQPQALTGPAWLDRFSKSEQLGYFYPVNEIYVTVDLTRKAETQTVQKLSALLEDPYQLFCLKQELDRYRLRYYLNKQENGVDLLIYSQDSEKLDDLVETLKKYEIQASVTPIEEVVDGKI